MHTMLEMFEVNAGTGWGLQLVDVNREAALRNSRVLWPRCSPCLFNTNHGSGTTDVIFSREGVTQGDPLSMLMYALVDSLSSKIWPTVQSGSRSGMQITLLVPPH